MIFTWVDIIGLAAATCTTVAFLPQVIKVWKTKSATDISLAMFLVLTTGVVLWLIYGIIIVDISIIAANTVTLLLSGSILYFKLTYK